MAYVIVGVVLMVWAAFAVRAVVGRSQETTEALTYLTRYGEAYAKYAETLIQFGADPGSVIDRTAERSEDATSPEQHLLADFREQLHLDPEIQLRLRRFEKRAPTEITRAVESGVLNVTVPRPLVGFEATVSWPESGALDPWWEQFLFEGATLVVVTMLMAGLGGVLVREVRRQERADITRRLLERQLYHSQRLDALGRLAGGIAHDLNNALVPILALSKLAIRRTSEGSALQEDLSLVYQAGVRARDLVKRILAFGRKDTGELKEVQLAEVANEAQSMLRSTVSPAISVAGRIESAPLILGDPTQIHQVIINLGTNAIQAIGAGPGQVSIEVTQSEMPDQSGCRAARLVVADTGCGMTPEIVTHVFEPFYTTKPLGEGTGLGLAVVHGIVTAMGGSIDVSSEIGRGTTFTVLIPAAATTATERRAA